MQDHVASRMYIFFDKKIRLQFTNVCFTLISGGGVYTFLITGWVLFKCQSSQLTLHKKHWGVDKKDHHCWDQQELDPEGAFCTKYLKRSQKARSQVFKAPCTAAIAPGITKRKGAIWRQETQKKRRMGGSRWKSNSSLNSLDQWKASIWRDWPMRAKHRMKRRKMEELPTLPAPETRPSPWPPLPESGNNFF